jgi:cysteinyl-tRNA synthetase
VTLRLYDTATRSVRPFTPLQPGKVSLYHCGATVQYLPHIGHLRGAGIVYDVLRRWLDYRGYEVTQVRNVTDIDDKILTKAAAAGEPWWAWATKHEHAFADAYDLLGCLRPTIEPRATGHIPQILALIAELVDAGRAYAADGDVYFAVRTLDDYGSLSGQRIDEMVQGESEGAGKRDPADFTLWKGAKPAEPQWSSPWGPGRPGWHIECTAMARTYLGDEFDIHGGGLDLVFPHHENEAAQAHGAALPFARYWMHSHWVTLAGEKMSKSLGNTLNVRVLTEQVRPIELRYYLVSVHYRSSIEYSPEALADAARSFGRMERFLRRVAAHVGRSDDAVTGAADDSIVREVGSTTTSMTMPALPAAFAEAMDDDLSVPRALAVAHDAVRARNTASSNGDWHTAAARADEVRAMLAVLGLDPFAEPWARGDASHASDARLRAAVGTLLSGMLGERTAARQARDFHAADAIRDRLARSGFAIEDTPDGPVWSVTDPGPESAREGES